MCLHMDGLGWVKRGEAETESFCDRSFCSTIKAKAPHKVERASFLSFLLFKEIACDVLAAAPSTWEVLGVWSCLIQRTQKNEVGHITEWETFWGYFSISRSPTFQTPGTTRKMPTLSFHLFFEYRKIIEWFYCKEKDHNKAECCWYYGFLFGFMLSLMWKCLHT